MTPDTYHQDTRHVSNSGITLLLKSPAHYHAKYLATDRQPFDTAAFKLGRAFHVAASEPHKFMGLYHVARGSIDGRTREGRLKKQAMEVAARGKVVLQERPTRYENGKRATSLSYEQVMRMRDSLMAHPIAAELMRDGQAEQIHTWDDYLTGVPCKRMADWLPAKHRIILDFKTCQDASPAGFLRSVIKYGYHRQAVHYLDGEFDRTGHPDTLFVFAAVETHTPYLTELYILSADLMEIAREQRLTALERYKTCVSSGVWHGYNPERTVKILSL